MSDITKFHKERLCRVARDIATNVFAPTLQTISRNQIVASCITGLILFYIIMYRLNDMQCQYVEDNWETKTPQNARFTLWCQVYLWTWYCLYNLNRD